MLEPISSGQWDYAKAAHLLNRAGFGGPPFAIQKLADLGPEKALSSLLDYETIPDPAPAPEWAKPDPDGIRQFREAVKNATPEEKRKLQKKRRQTDHQRMIELRGWWLNRMAKGPRPFQEKMVLFWHGHFATSVIKVKNPYYMWRQNELFRRMATGNWLELLTYAGKDPAMLIWLDQAQSRKPHANENYAREVMELFTLGEGHYTEKEMTEAARALTGWSLDRKTEKFIYRPFFHDNGIKIFFGQAGNLNGDDIMRIIVAQPQAAVFITGKLWNFFAGQMPSPALNQSLANVFRTNGNNFKPLLRVMFRSGEFYAPSVVRNQVKSPTQWLVSATRTMECDLPPAFISAAILRNLGQDLFAPPNVKGWDGGLAWITTNTLLDRYNKAAVLVQGTTKPLRAADFARKPGRKGGKRMARETHRVHIGGVDVAKLLTPEERENKDKLLAALQHRLLQAPLFTNQDQALRKFLDSRPKLTEREIRLAIRLVMSTPEYQVT